MRVILGCLSLVLIAFPAHAGWEKVFESESLARYVDPDQVVKDDEGDGYRTVPVLTAYKRADPSLPGVLSTVSLYEYDCRRSRSRELAYFFHSGVMAEGNPVRAEPRVTRWFPKPQNPAFALAMTKVCSL